MTMRRKDDVYLPVSIKETLRHHVYKLHAIRGETRLWFEHAKSGRKRQLKYKCHMNTITTYARDVVICIRCH